MVAALNARFADARPSNDLAEAGVLLRQFDTLDDKNHPWLPCPKDGPDNWCFQFSDRWAVSVVSPRAKHLYYGTNGKGGLVLAPTAKLFCAYPEDGNSMAKVCHPLGGDGVRCIPGCYPKGQWCPELHHAWSCSFPPTHLKEALQAQEGRIDFRMRNNELVVDLSSVSANLPSAIEGFFYFPGSGAAERAKAAEARQAFLGMYGLTEADGPPLLLVDLSDGGGDAPFSLA